MNKIIILTACLGIASCSNTFDGMGRDIENMGQKIQNVSMLEPAAGEKKAAKPSGDSYHAGDSY